jgi:hypothetical protein
MVYLRIPSRARDRSPLHSIFLGFAGRHWQQKMAHLRAHPNLYTACWTKRSHMKQIIIPLTLLVTEGLWRHRSLRMWDMWPSFVHAAAALSALTTSHTRSSEGTEWEFNILQTNLFTSSYCCCKSPVFYFLSKSIKSKEVRSTETWIMFTCTSRKYSTQTKTLISACILCHMHYIHFPRTCLFTTFNTICGRRRADNIKLDIWTRLVWHRIWTNGALFWNCAFR